MNKVNNIYKITIPIITFVVMFGFVFYKADAITLSPARIEVKADAGTTVTKDITVYNDQEQASTYYISYANFEAQGETGSPKFVEPKNGLGTWMDAGESVYLEAGQSKNIPLSIKIPSDAYAGGHFAVVFFGTVPESKDGGQVTVGAKTGTLVLLSVNGDVLEAGGLADFNTKNNKFFYNSLPVEFQYRFKNDGNDRVKPEGSLTIKNILYITKEKINANAVSGNILPHSTRLFDLEWINYRIEEDASDKTFIKSYFDKVYYQWKNFAVGPYMAKLDLVYGTEDIHTTKYKFLVVFPWQLLIVIFIVLMIVYLVGKKLVKKYNNYIIKKARLHISQ